MFDLPQCINAIELPGRFQGQVLIAKDQGARFEPAVDSIYDQFGHDIVLGAATPDVDVGENHAAGKAGVKGGVREDVGELAKEEMPGWWPGSGMRDVHPVKAEDLVVREALHEVRVRPPRAEAEFHDYPLFTGQPPGGEIYAVPLGDLSTDVGVESAHELARSQNGPGHPGAARHSPEAFSPTSRSLGWDGVSLVNAIGNPEGG